MSRTAEGAPAPVAGAGCGTLAPATIPIMATACAFCVATIYYNQPLLPQMSASFGRAATASGVLATLTQLGYAAGLFLLVPLGDLVDRGRLILTILLLNMTSLLAVAVAPNYVAIAAASLAVGMTAVSAQIIIPSISGLVPPEARGRTLGTLMGGMSAGLLFARTLSGFVGAYAGWRAMFGLAVAIDASLILIIALYLPRTKQTDTLSYPALIASLWPLLRREPALQAACMTGFFMFASFSALWSTLATLLARPPLELKSDTIGAFGFIGIAGLLASPWIGRAVDIFTARRVLAVGAITMLLAFIMLGVATFCAFTLIISMMLMDIANRAGLISNQTRIYGLSSGARSRLNTVFMTSYFLGGAAGSSIAANAVDRFGWSGLATTGVALSVAAIAGHFATDRRQRGKP